MAYPPGPSLDAGASNDEIRLIPEKDEAAEIDEIRSVLAMQKGWADMHWTGAMRTSVLSVSRFLLARSGDLTLLDWIQDSLHERHVRSKPPGDPNSFFVKMNASRGILGWVWRAVGNTLEEGQGLVIVTLVG